MLTKIDQNLTTTLDWRERYIDWLRERNLSQVTIEIYLVNLKYYIEWFERVNGVAFNPGLLNSMDVRQYRTWTLDTMRLSAATWNQRRATLGTLCRFTEDCYDIQLFPMRKVPGAIEEDKPPRWLNEKDRRALLRELELEVNAANTENRRVRAIRDQAMVGVMIFSGLRVSEIVNLEIEDLKLSERKGEVFVRNGKREKSRHVALSSTTREMLGAWLKVRPENAERLFTDENGKWITTRAVEKRVQRLADKLGIEGLAPHALRHTCAKSILNAGGQLTEVKKLLGHKRLDTTERYVQPGQEDLENAVEMGEMGKVNQYGGTNGRKKA